MHPTLRVEARRGTNTRRKRVLCSIGYQLLLRFGGQPHHTDRRRHGAERHLDRCLRLQRLNPVTSLVKAGKATSFGHNWDCQG